MNKQRHLKTRKKNTWSSLRMEMARTCEEKKLSKSDFNELNINTWEEVKAKIWSEFSASFNTRWIWDSLAVPNTSIQLDDSFELTFESLIPGKQKCWFVLDETVNEKTKYWIYEGTISAFDQIFANISMLNEVMIVSKKYDWMLLLNHHDILVGTGIMMGRIEKMRNPI